MVCYVINEKYLAKIQIWEFKEKSSRDPPSEISWLDV